MKKIFFIFVFVCVAVASAMAQAEIKFEKTTFDFGTFSQKSPVQNCVFNFTNTGDKPLTIEQAVASCGCTVPTLTKKTFAPGEKGQIKVTYNGAGRFAGHFKKTITVRSNAKSEMVRLYIEGDMTE